ncbi:hypothetical protein Scep_018088 [Stephania cephalantha]|uniref:Uncharacterized protein n=1 Tax=Stephania cephalantha TaxID=152367 RepID=A0AAP0NW89_9MAGN
MVSKGVTLAEFAKSANQQQQIKGREHKQQLMQYNKSKVCRFKKSYFSTEEDGASSAIILLACIACAPSTSI